MLLTVFSAAAQKNYVSDKVVFLPQDFYVGDYVEMRVVITPEEGVEVERPENFPESYWVKIENAGITALDDGDYELRVFLRPFAPGIRTLPALQFGDVLLRDIRIQTKSVLEDEDASFAPPAGQMLLPGTKYYIALLVGLVFLLPLFFIFFWTKLKGRLLSYIHEVRRRRPYKRLIKALKELEDGMGDKKGKEFYTILVAELRAYLTARGSIDYLSSTVRESAIKITEDFGSVDGYNNLIAVFQLADQVKFGGKRVMNRKREQDLDAIRELVEGIEEAAAGGNENVDT